jgi:tetratricopeptide (TPR) repeat protein
LRVVLSLILAFLVLAPAVSLSAAPDAMALLRNGRADEALQVLNSRVQKAPNDAAAYSLMGRVYFQLEDWDDAIRAGEKSVALSTQEGEYHQWLGRAWGKKAEAAGPVTALNLVRKVKAEFEKAVALDPEGKNLSARVDLAEFYIEAPYVMGGDKTKAKRIAAFVMTRDSALAYYILGRLEEKQNARIRAEQEFKAAIEASGNLADYWVALASYYQRTGQLDAMETAVTKSLAAPRKDGIPLFDGGSVLLRGGRNFSGAIHMFQQYLSLDDPAEDGPAFQAHYFIGLLLEKQGDAKAAAGEYRAALALASQFRPAQQGLSRVAQ